MKLLYRFNNSDERDAPECTPEYLHYLLNNDYVKHHTKTLGNAL